MRNIYPLFEQNRILKKELLWSLRDYSFAHLQLEYQDYGQGILRGCDISVRGGQIEVGPGIVKCGEFICLLMEAERIPYEPAEQMQYLKVKIDVDRSSPDYTAYQINLFLDLEETRTDHEFELCRFHLRKGAKLRDRYTGFSDMGTEYDTVKLIDATWGGIGGASLSPAVTRNFARELLASENSLPEDRAFAYLSLSQPGAVPPQVVAGYVSNRLEARPEGSWNHLQYYKALCSILAGIQAGGEKGVKNVKERRRILVD